VQKYCKEYVTDTNKQVEDELMYKDLYSNVVVAKYELNENKNKNRRVELPRLGNKMDEMGLVNLIFSDTVKLL